MLSLIIYAEYKGFQPNILLNEDKKDSIQWKWYFEPLVKQENTKDVTKFKVCKRRDSLCTPQFNDAYNKINTHIWCQLYKKYFKFNIETKEYIEQEYQRLIAGKRILGVICRGTDYLILKPSGHPIQPTIDEVIECCQKYMLSDKYDGIYLATEERQIRDVFIKNFPGKIIENKRTYYDDIFNKNSSISYIKDVHFERENDNYLKGLEYLSSIILLSRCTALIGGNCGGTLGALFFNDEKYEFKKIFDLGLYP